MKASTEKKVYRWLHLILSIPIIGYIYGPLSQFPRGTTAVRWIFVPLVTLTGLWMWKGQVIRKKWRSKRALS